MTVNFEVRRPTTIQDDAELWVNGILLGKFGDLKHDSWAPEDESAHDDYSFIEMALRVNPTEITNIIFYGRKYF